MPMYEFECRACGERFERLVDVGTETATCTRCGTEGAERKLSSFGLSRMPTPNQQRRMEDNRATNRGGARRRFQKTLDSARKRNPPKPGQTGRSGK